MKNIKNLLQKINIDKNGRYILEKWATMEYPKKGNLAKGERTTIWGT